MKQVFLILLIISWTSLYGQWITQHVSISQSLNGINVRPAGEGWVVGNNGIIYHLSNNGYQWETESGLPITESFNDVCFVSQTDGWCVGTVNGSSNGKIYRRTDQGTWEPLNTPANTRQLLALSCIDGISQNNHFLCAVGFSKEVLISPNSGFNLSPPLIPPPTGSALRDVYFIDRNKGWAVGNIGVITRTINGGSSWSDTLSTPSNEWLYGVYFSDKNLGWVVGNEGTIWKTIDGGDSWIDQNPGQKITSARLHTITGIDDMNLIIVGVNGTVLLTSDGGDTWNPVSGLIGDFNDVAMVDTENYWIVGDNGANYYSEGTIKFGADSIGADASFKIGTEKLISFETTFNSLVDLHYQSDADTIWTPVILNYPASNGIFPWTMPTLPSTGYQLRIRSSQKQQVEAISQPFEIFQIPEITIDPASIRPEKGKELQVQVRITGDNDTTNILFFRQGGETIFSDSISLTQFSEGGDVFHATIPASLGDFSINERGFEFFVKSIESSRSNTTISDTISLHVSIVSADNSILGSMAGANEIYQMISIDYDLNEKGVNSVLEDDLGSYDRTQWRLWQWLTDQQRYGELNTDNIGDFSRAKSFWVASVNNKFVSDGGQSYSLTDYVLELQPGWNQVGLPFAFPVSSSDIDDANPDIAGVSQFYDYSNNNWVPVDNALEPRKGYFVDNMNQVKVDLKIPSVAADRVPISGRITNTPLQERRIQLLVKNNQVRDTHNYIGMQDSSSPEWDQLDQPEPPPPIGNYISLYFPHDDWQRYPGRYTSDFRPEIQDLEVWNIVVETNVLNPASEIRFNNIESVSDEFEVYILDKTQRIFQNLRENPGLKIGTIPYPGKTELKLIIGKEDFVQQHNLKNEIPNNYELNQNFPNPFKLATAIPYQLPTDGKVTIRIYNIRGELIATPLDGTQKVAGFHLQTWNAQDEFGKAVSSGLYFYQIITSGFTGTKKMLLKN